MKAVVCLQLKICWTLDGAIGQLNHTERSYQVVFYFRNHSVSSRFRLHATYTVETITIFSNEECQLICLVHSHATSLVNSYLYLNWHFVLQLSKIVFVQSIGSLDIP